MPLPKSAPAIALLHALDLQAGPLFFPVTPFDDGGVNRDALAAHIDAGLHHRPAAVFVACGTGELHALSQPEYEAVVEQAVATVAGQVPIFAGTGGPLPAAQALARCAAAAGCDGILALPPYLAQGPTQGLVEYTRAVVMATDLPAIVYNRPEAKYSPSAAATIASLPNVVGFKDGLGDLDLMLRIVYAVKGVFQTTRERPIFFNGLPTAELTAQAYRAIGVFGYSSAIFAFVPEISRAFFDALASGDAELLRRLAEGFLGPFAELRAGLPGGAISLVKAGARVRGLSTGGVRAPLTDPDGAQLATLRGLIERGLEIVNAGSDTSVAAGGRI